MNKLVNGLFDVFDLSLYLIGLGTVLCWLRAWMDMRGSRKWWQMESWRARFARWNRQLSI